VLLALLLVVHVLKGSQRLAYHVELDFISLEILVYNAQLIVKLAQPLDVQPV